MAGRFILNILGSASAKPNLKRQSSAQLLQAAEHLFLIDCAEGTQTALLRQNELLSKWSASQKVQGVKRLSRSKLDAICISHIHGDHMFGLFPLLSTMGLNGRTKPLKIFGPNALGSIITFYKSFWGDKDQYEIEFIPLKMKGPEVVMEVPGLEVVAFPLKHGIESYGFLFREIGLCTLRKQPYVPRSFAYCSDTMPFPELSQWVSGVDLLYHEATYMQADVIKAHSRFHSTTIDAASCARDAGVGRLAVAHYSSGIKSEDIQGRYIDEVRSVFADALAVEDGQILDIPEKFLY